MGRTKRQVKRVKTKAGERVLKRRSKQKLATLLAELRAADFIVFPTEILNSGMELDIADEPEMQDGLELISQEFTSPAVEYWKAPLADNGLGKLPPTV